MRTIESASLQEMADALVKMGWTRLPGYDPSLTQLCLDSPKRQGAQYSETYVLEDAAGDFLMYRGEQANGKFRDYHQPPITMTNVLAMYGQKTSSALALLPDAEQPKAGTDTVPSETGAPLSVTQKAKDAYVQVKDKVLAKKDSGKTNGLLIGGVVVLGAGAGIAMALKARKHKGLPKPGLRKKKNQPGRMF